MKRLITYLLSILLSVSLLAQNKPCIQKSAQLETAYRTKSVKLLASFLDSWQEATERELRMKNTKDPLTSNIYAIHRVLFDPFDYKIFGWVAWGNRTWFTGTKYIVIQDKIPFTTRYKIDTLNANLEYAYSDTVFSFRPDIRFTDVKTLLMSDEYRCVAKSFIQADTFEKEMEYYERKAFLDTLLTTTMNRNWTAILSQPRIIGVALCSNGFAVVDYQIASTGMRSLLKYEEGKWVIKQSLELWIAD
jgi:hypothetical protein